ncbi:MAG: hypothetical protein GEU90_20435 [Gemmatimonas sp.]|nr:hypothetical protein [Gemmatimonas sp.]
MPSSIMNPEAERLARELARITGESLTEAVTNALRDRLEREIGRVTKGSGGSRASVRSSARSRRCRFWTIGRPTRSSVTMSAGCRADTMDRHSNAAAQLIDGGASDSTRSDGRRAQIALERTYCFQGEIRRSSSNKLSGGVRTSRWITSPERRYSCKEVSFRLFGRTTTSSIIWPTISCSAAITERSRAVKHSESLNRRTPRVAGEREPICSVLVSRRRSTVQALERWTNVSSSNNGCAATGKYPIRWPLRTPA